MSILEQIREKFPEYEVELIDKGWSTDIKFLLTNRNEKYTLRVSENKSLKDQIKEYEAVGTIKDCNQIITPIKYGSVDKRRSYIIYSYIEGDDLIDVIGKITPTKQYDLGIQAGEVLRKIHEVVNPDIEVVSAQFNRKITNKIKAYRECSVHQEKLEESILFIERNRHLLEDRPSVLLHGDYHIGNMILRNGEVYIIDFNRYDYGDPYEEFDRMTLNRNVSPQFSKGLLHGYFKGVPSEKFWCLLKLYILTNAVGSIPWAQRFSPESMDFVYEMMDHTLNDYKDGSSPIPKWYKELIGWNE